MQALSAHAPFSCATNLIKSRRIVFCHSARVILNSQKRNIDEDESLQNQIFAL